MQSRRYKLPLFLSLLLLSTSSLAEKFSLSSIDITHGKLMKKAQEFKGFGCDGDNVSPQLAWKNAPAGTKAFAITAYDPDAPTGSGWWHWQIVNIPLNVTFLPTNAGDFAKNLAPKDSIQITNDYGIEGFGGACPPKGHGIHRYQFTVYALSSLLEFPKNASSALIGYMIHANSLGSATIEALYQR